MRIELTRAQASVLLSAAAYWETVLEDQAADGIVDGRETAGDLRALEHAMAKLADVLR